jgi:hypothetical protein
MAYYTDERRYFHELADHGDKKRILFAGDSWFSISDLANIPIQFEKQFDLSILCLADPGNTLAELVSGTQFERWCSVIGNDKTGQKWDAIVLSAGGNDVIGPDIGSVLKPPAVAGSLNPQDYLDAAALEKHFAEIRRRLLVLRQIRDESSINQATPIFIHSYAWVTPRNVAHKVLAWKVAGPWIYPNLVAQGIGDCALQSALVGVLTDLFFAELQKIAQEPNSNFHAIDVRHVLPPVPHMTRDADNELWDDEIHPSSKGFEILACQHFIPALQKMGIV